MKQSVSLAGGIEQLFGTRDENLKLIESVLGVTTMLRDNQLDIEGEPESVERAARIIEGYNEMILEGRAFDYAEVKSALRLALAESDVTLRSVLAPSRPRVFGKKTVTPRSPNQRRYMELMEKYDMVFAIGPGGTGKTYLAVAMAVSALLTKQVNRIILVRPAVEAGERLGFLAGTNQEKVDPYMRPLYDAP